MISVDDYVLDQLTILRRTAERGRAFALEKEETRFVDLFQHMLDEIERVYNHLN